MLQGLRVDFMVEFGVFKPFGGDDGIELVVPQVGANVHALEPGFAVLDGQCGFIQRHI